MDSTRSVQLSLLLVLFILEQPSFAHIQLGNDAVDLKNVPFEVPKKHHMNVQVETLEPKAESTLKAHQHEGANYNKKYESTEFVDAANEVENLMWRDYSGRARRKPPIHNYNPTTKH